MRRRVKNVHFVGIGGIGMSGIAEVLLNLGYSVSGSDLKASDVTRRLGELGAQVHIGHDEAHVADADVVVISTAIRGDNPELLEAKSRKIPVVPRGEMLAELMRMKTGIAISGTHGKTTTTSMVATVLAEAGLDPTAVIGGKLDRFDSNAKLGAGELLVAEADESDGSFLLLNPTVAVVTNIDPEHLDHYGTTSNLMQAFEDFANKVPFYGCTVLCLDDSGARAMLPSVRRRVITYGLDENAQVRGTDVQTQGFGSSFTVEGLGTIQLRVPGVHNVTNALAAVAVAFELEVPFDKIKAGLEGYGGLRRRFEKRGEAGGVTVVDDYGHHPTEIRATLAAARATGPGRIVAVFQPHRYTRTQNLFDEFVGCFGEADVLVITEIYPGGESAIEGVSGKRLADAIDAADYVETLDEIPAHLAGRLKENDMVLLLGAGSITHVAAPLLAALRKT